MLLRLVRPMEARKQRTEERERERATAEHTESRERFRQRFLTLTQEGNAQARGYMLETFLNEFLSFVAGSSIHRRSVRGRIIQPARAR